MKQWKCCAVKNQNDARSGSTRTSVASAATGTSGIRNSNEPYFNVQPPSDFRVEHEYKAVLFHPDGKHVFIRRAGF